MKIEVTATVYDGQKFEELGYFESLERAHAPDRQAKFIFQQTFEDIDQMSRSIPYLHLMEFRDEEHYNDLYFTAINIKK